MVFKSARRLLAASLLIALSGPAWAEWQEGDFTGALSWEGAVTHNDNPWVWTGPGKDARKQERAARSGADNTAAPKVLKHLILAPNEADRAGGQHVWKGLLEQITLLAGKTERLVPQGRAGIEPVVLFGKGDPDFQLEWQSNGEARLTIPVKRAGDEGAKIGRLSFAIRVAAAAIATQGGQRQVFNLHARAEGGEAAGNGLPPRGKTVAAKEGLEMYQRIFGEKLPAGFTLPLPQERRGGEVESARLTSAEWYAIGSAYGAEIIAGSGLLTIADGALPREWRAALPIQITYQ